MRASLALLFSFVASTLAYSVSTPSTQQGWTNQGSQSVSWQRVDTDRLNFTIVLTNQNRAVLPQDLVLAAEVDGTLLNTTVRPPSSGWPTGPTFRVNFVNDVNNLNSILAQSSEFNITSPTSSTSVSVKSGTPSTLNNPPPTSTATNPATTSDSTSQDANPPNNNGAISSFGPPTGVFGLLAVIGVLLA